MLAPRLSAPALLALVLLALPGPAQKARRYPYYSVTLEALADNTLYEDPSGNLSNGAGAHLFAGLNAFGLIRRAVLAFDVASVVPAGANITSAVLTLHVTRTVAGPESVSLHLLLADWGEGTSDALGEEGTGAPATANDATWLHTFHPGSSWQTPGGDFVSMASATRTVGFTGPQLWSSGTMVADAQAWLDDPSTNHGWIVIGAEPPAGIKTAKRFGSSEGVPVLRPALKVLYELP